VQSTKPPLQPARRWVTGGRPQLAHNVTWDDAANIRIANLGRGSALPCYPVDVDLHFPELGTHQLTLPRFGLADEPRAVMTYCQSER